MCYEQEPQERAPSSTARDRQGGQRVDQANRQGRPGQRTMKMCSKCHEEKELTEFHRKKKTGDGLQAECKTCRLKLNREYLQEIIYTTPLRTFTRHMGRHLKRAYKLGNGLPGDEGAISACKAWQQMWDDQKGCCNICQTLMTPTGTVESSVHVDHCHKQGHVRGMLCARCNKAHGVWLSWVDSGILAPLLDYESKHALG